MRRRPTEAARVFAASLHVLSSLRAASAICACSRLGALFAAPLADGRNPFSPKRSRGSWAVV